MPLIEVKAFETRFRDREAAKRLIVAMTDALCEILGEDARAETWVIVEGVDPSKWGLAGEVRE